MTQVIEKYLHHYAETEISALSDFPPEHTFNHVLVIPAYKEDSEFIDRLAQSQFSDCLIIVVINQPAAVKKTTEGFPGPYWPHPKNILLEEEIASRGQLLWQRANLKFFDCGSFAVLTVDRFACNPIPAKQGVGLARKIGCDIAVRLINEKIVSSFLIHTSDADVVFPGDYLQQTVGDPNVSAQLYGFEHVCKNTAIGIATAMYELSIRYYVDGLKWARSPYAFHTIGSCIAISVIHYCQARGFPKRNGGEDFYLLNKLAKLGKVVELKGRPLQILARESDRAPFGTGPAVAKILAQSDQAFLDYDPIVFLTLRQLQHQLSKMPEAVLSDRGEAWLATLGEPGRMALCDIGVRHLFEHIRSQRYDVLQATKHIPMWFDGFRTLKFINHLQRYHYAAIPQDQALKEFEELKSGVN